MALTEKDKQRIKEEEEYRAKVRSEKTEIKEKGRNPFMTCLFWVMVIIGIPSILLALYVSKLPTPEINTPTESVNKEFKATVAFDGSQFTITNLDIYDCVQSRMVVNNDYTLEGYNLKQGETYTVGAGQFTDNNDVRFNPFAIKPRVFSITCRSEDPHNYSTTSWIGNFN